MKTTNKVFILIAGLATTGTALAVVNPTRPMLTGHGNVSGCPGHLIVTNQTDPNATEALKLDKFVVTGSLIHPPTKEALESASREEPKETKQERRKQ
jgi:hypothetical protein